MKLLFAENKADGEKTRGDLLFVENSDYAIKQQRNECRVNGG
jgi:hypothetical protein